MPLPNRLPQILARTLPTFALSCASLWLHGATAATPPPSAAPAAGVYERVLSNGMKVIVREDHRAPTVVHLVLYRAGSMDEENGTTGVAHVLEHMMFQGTTAVPAGEFSRRVAALGGRENAFTSRDYTGYFQQIGSRHLADVMALETDRMNNLAIAQTEFAKEIRVVMEERRLRTDDRAQALVYEELMASAYISSPYRTPVVGWMSDLQSMTADDVRHWYRSWYTPSNAVLVVAGDVSAEEVHRLAQDTYGRVEAHALPVRKPQQEAPQRGERRSFVSAPAENPYVALGFKVPRLRDVEHDLEPYALEVLSAVLDADENGRFTRNIVRGSRIANRVGAGYDAIGRGPAMFVLDGTPADGRTTVEVEQALRDEIRRIAREGVGEDELRRIKTQYVASQIYKRDSLMGQAMEIGSLEMSGLSHRDADRILQRIRAVTSTEVQAVAARYFDDQALTVVTLLPQPISAAPPHPQVPGMRQD